jgi:transcriptional regulator with XRE-family HTH domain
LDSKKGKRPPISQKGARTIRRGSAYAVLQQLCEGGEDLFQATVRCSARAPHRQSDTFLGLIDGTIKPPPLTSAGVALLLRHEVDLAEYMVEMSPDPRKAKLSGRLVPAEPIRRALRAAGYAVVGTRRASDACTHAELSAATGIARRTISRLCNGTTLNLPIAQAEAILDHLERPDLIHELVYPAIDQSEREQCTQALVEENLEWEYEHLWFGSRGGGLSDDERLALSDLHEMYDEWQHDRELARLPFRERRSATTDHFRARNGREPHPIPDSLRERAERSLHHQHRRLVTYRKQTRQGIGDPTAATSRDLIRRGRQQGRLDPTQGPIAFNADRARAKPRATCNAIPAVHRHYQRGIPLTHNQRRLQQAERGVERQLAELRILRTAPDLEPHDPRRPAYRNRHCTLAAKAARRTQFRQHELLEITRSNRPTAEAGL